MKNHKTEQPTQNQNQEETPATEENQHPADTAPGENRATSPEGDAQQQPDVAEDPKAEANRYREIALRAQADFDNYRKRMAREKEESIRYANASMLEKLLPILDSFDLGIQAARKAPEAAAIAKGFEMVERQIHDFLRDCGVESVDAEGKDFDPNLHEAVSQQHHAETPEGKVLHQIRKGFKLKDRLLRPATVIVSRGKALTGVTA